MAASERRTLVARQYRRPDLELRFTTTDSLDIVIWAEIKHDSNPHTERTHRAQRPDPRRDDRTLHDRLPPALTATSLPAPYTDAQGESDPLLAIAGRAVRSSQNRGLIRLLYMTEPSRQDFLWR